MKRTSRLALILALTVFLMLMVSDTAPILSTHTLVQNDNDLLETYTTSDSNAPWWNSSFNYRRLINVTEPGISDRVNSPIHQLITFDDASCQAASIRVMYYENPLWVAVPYQMWNTTYYSGGEFIESTMISFLVNVSQATSDTDYFVYYAKTDVGTVSYPDCYPFIYRSNTYSLINLVSYYDDNNYLIEMWDGAGWDDPTNFDPKWSAGEVTPSSVPQGTLDKYGNVHYEPDSYPFTGFWGYYTIYSYYPLAVTVGTGNMNQNPGINDWFPGVDQLGNGLSTMFILGGVEGYESGNEGKYWIQAHQDDTDVYVWTIAETPDSGWKYYNDTTITAWPATLNAGEYIYKRDVIYTSYMMANSSKPVSMRAGDSDSTYARDTAGYFPSTTGLLVGEEFYTIDMGNRKDKTRVTNIGPSSVTVEWWRNDGSGWVKGTDLSIPANGSAYISRGTSAIDDPDDVLHIKGPAGSQLYVEGLRDPPKIQDCGDWAPTLSGNRFGTDYRIWGGSGMKFVVIAWENAQVDITGWNGAQLDIPAGTVNAFMPLSSSHSLFDIQSNASISVIVSGEFDTATEEPSGDQGYGWMVPAYTPMGDDAGVDVTIGAESTQSTLEITVVDLDGIAIEGATVTLYNTDDSVWLDGNGQGRSGTTDSLGFIAFENLANQTYRIRTLIDAAGWLSTSFSNIWVTDSTDEPLTGAVTSVQTSLALANLEIHLDDLDGLSMNDAVDEDTWLRLNNETGSSDDYIAQAITNASGWVKFNRIPQDAYDAYISYAGGEGWNYNFTDISNFGMWTIPDSAFLGGSFVISDWEVPLISLNIHVTTWDDLALQGATIKIDNTVNPSLYTITRSSNLTGDYTFYRILNGSWNVDVSKEDAYATTPIARNNTVTLVNQQSAASHDVQVPLSRLLVRVYTDDFDWVENAQVNVSMRGFGLVAQGLTDSQGYAAFFNIHANLSSPYSVSYNMTVQYGTEYNGTIFELIAKCDYDWGYINYIRVPTPVFGGTYTELNATQYFINLRWGQNASFISSYYKRNDTGTFALPLDATSWLNFTIYNGATVIGQGSWNLSAHDWVEQISASQFNITIASLFWSMGIMEDAYSVVVIAHTDGYDDPTQITIYINLLPALTTEGIESAAIYEYYGTHYPHDFWMYDSTNGENVSALAVYSYVVLSGLTPVASGTLVDNLDGTYTFPDSALDMLPVGSYVVTVTLEKRNYENLTIVIGAFINSLPMTVEIFSPSDYDWSLGTETVDFNYTISWNSTATDLQGVSVQVEWINHGTGLVYTTEYLTLDAAGTLFTYSFSADILPVGEWRIRITASKPNYESAVAQYSVLTVSPAPTLLSLTPILTTVDWTETGVVQLTFTRVSDGLGLAGATIAHNWTTPVIIDYEGAGVYTLYIDTTIPAQSLVIAINATISNHVMDFASTTITIRVPLLIENEFASDETPLIAYWTRTFDVIVRLLDNSRVNTPIDDGTIDFYWTIPGGIDQSGTLTPLGNGLYGIVLDSNDANILVSEYQISLDATRAGSTSASSTVFLILEEVPNEILLANIINLPYYGDVVTITFYWNNTLDNIPVTNPTSASFYVEPLGIEIGSYINYGNGTYSFDVDTRSLGMHEYLYGAFYEVSIVMSANGLEAHLDTTAYFLVRETPTRMDVVSQYSAEWSENITITADIFDTIHNEYVWTGATAALIYGPYAIPMTSFGNGTFFVTINTTHYFSSSGTPYDIDIVYTIPDYVNGIATFEILVQPLTTEVIIETVALQDNTHELDWADSFTVEFTLQLPARPTARVPEGSALFYWIEYPEVDGVFAYSSLNDQYSATVDAGLVIAGHLTLRISVQLDNHTIAPVDIDVNVLRLEAALSTDTDLIQVFYGTDTIDISLHLTYDGNNLESDRVYTVWGGTERQFSTWDGENYRFEFNPSLPALSAPSLHLLNFSAELDNYTVGTLQVPLFIMVRTQLSGSTVSVEAGDSTIVYFRYWDLRNDYSVPDATVRAILPGSALEVVPEFNGSHYYFTYSPTDLEVQQEAYSILLTASAFGYQNYTSSDGVSLNLFVREPTYNLPFIGRQPRSLINTALLLLAAVGIIAASSVAVRRARIPYQIKQINRALKQIEADKTAEVSGIKSLEVVISEILSAGLAELDIAPPAVEILPDEDVADLFDEETLALLDQVDALRALDEPLEAAVKREVPAVEDVVEIQPDEGPDEEDSDSEAAVETVEEEVQLEDLPDFEMEAEPESAKEFVETREPVIAPDESVEDIELPDSEIQSLEESEEFEELPPVEDEAPHVDEESEINEISIDEVESDEPTPSPEEDLAEDEILEPEELEELDSLDDTLLTDEVPSPDDIEPIDEDEQALDDSQLATEAPDDFDSELLESELIEDDLSEADESSVKESRHESADDGWESIISELRVRIGDEPIPPKIKDSYTKEELEVMSDEELEAIIRTLEEEEEKKEDDDE